LNPQINSLLSLPSLHFILSQMSINPYIYICRHSHSTHKRSLIACHIQTLMLCIVVVLLSYSPTVMDFFHTLPTYTLFSFPLTYSRPPGGLSWGLRNDCHYSSFLFCLSFSGILIFLL
jgi:hypothetical protein